MNNHVAVALVVVIQFQGHEIAAERIYWNQVAVFWQVGLLRPE